MADGTMPVTDADAVERVLDVETLTVGSNTVLRQRDRVAGSGAAEIADVKNAIPGSALYGVVVRQAPDTNNVTSFAGGNVAHDAADSGNPVKTGGRGRGAFSAVVGNNDRVDELYDLYGRGITLPYAPGSAAFGSISPAMTAAAAAATVVATGGAGTTHYVTSIHAVNNGTVSTLVTLRSGTVSKFVLSAPLGAAAGPAIALPVPLAMNANEPITAILETAPAGSVFCTVLGFTA